MTWNEQWKDIREQEDGRFNKLRETKMQLKGIIIQKPTDSGIIVK